MYKLTERIVRESDFAFLSLRGGSREKPRSSETGKSLVLYGGDEFEYHIYCSRSGFGIPSHARLILEAGSRRYPLAGADGKVRIAGPIGEPMPAIIINQDRRSDCDLKIIIKSTDRTRIQTQFESLLDTIQDAKQSIASPSEEMAVEITYPLESAEVNMSFTMEGYAHLSDETYLWVLARPAELKGMWWPQGECRLQRDNRWSVQIQLGSQQSASKQFVVVAIVVSEREHAALNEYLHQSMRTNAWPSINMPDVLTPPIMREITTAIR